MQTIEHQRHKKMLDVAQLINSGKPAPAWLADALERTYAGLCQVLRAEMGTPTRKAMRERLHEIARCATKLEIELCDGVLLSHLERDRPIGEQGSDWTEHSRIVRALSDLAERAKRAAEEIPDRGGQGRPFANPYALCAREQCALYVVVAWTRVHGHPPGAESVNANEAAEVLWEAIGGKPPKENGSLAAWRKPFERVRSLGTEHVHVKLFQRILSEETSETLPVASRRTSAAAKRTE